MFKKDKESGEKSRSLLKNKEIRTLRADIIKQFPSLNEEQLSLVIPNKSQVFQAKLLSKTIVYYVESTPVIFDLNGRNNFYPTLQLLWHFPDMIMSFTIHGPVSEFIMNGADLMSAGIFDLTGLENLKEGSKVSIKIKGNPLPFALGDSLVNYVTLATPGKKRGKALSVVHLYGDRLSGSVPPNAGFGESVIYPTEDIPNYELEEDSSDEDDIKKPVVEQEESAMVEKVEGGDVVKEDSEDEEDAEEESDEEGDGEDESNGENQSDDEEMVEDEEDAMITKSPTTVTSAQMDEWLERALLLALKYVVKDHQLPMLASAFWTVLMRCHSSLPELSDAPLSSGPVVDLDVKRSRFKKVSAALRHYSNHRLVSIQDKAGVMSIVNVQRAHDLFRGVKVADPDEFKALVAKKAEAVSAEDDQTESTSVLISAVKKSSAPGDNKITVLELYKLTKQLKDIFGSGLHGVHGEFFVASELRDLLVAYIKEHSLESLTDKAQVTIGALLPLYKLVSDLHSKKATESSKALAAAVSVAPVTTKPSGSSSTSGSGSSRYDDDDDTVEQSFRQMAVRDPWAVSSAPVSLNIHKDGLIMLGDGAFPALSAGSVMPPPAPVDANRRAMPGSSSVGGWGVDKGVAWKAVSLPTAPPPSAASGKGKGPGGAKGPASNGGVPVVRPKKVVGANYVKSVSASAGGTAASGNNFLEVRNEDLVVRKDELFKSIISKASAYFGILTADGRLSVHSGQVAKVKVLLETRMGNKTVTILRNLEIFGVDMAGLTKDCQKRFACSVSLSSVPGIPKEKEVVLQGNFGLEIEGYLHSQCGVPRTMIEVTSAKGVKIKKKK